MERIATAVVEQFGAWSAPELAAVVLAVAYLLLAIRQNILCWPCAGLSTAIYVVLYADAKLYMESLLNVFYFAMAAYGFIVWRNRGAASELPIVVWPAQRHGLAIAIVVLLTGGCGFLLDRFSDAAYPYLDSLTTFAALWATYLVARKVLENWWYWLAIDAVSVAIFWERGLHLTSLLFLIYVAIIPFGLFAWSRARSQQLAMDSV